MHCCFFVCRPLYHPSGGLRFVNWENMSSWCPLTLSPLRSFSSGLFICKHTQQISSKSVHGAQTTVLVICSLERDSVRCTDDPSDIHWMTLAVVATLVHCAVPVRPADLSHRHTHRVVHYRHSSDRSFRSLWLEDIYSQLDRENERKGTLHRLCSEIDSIKSCSSCTNWSEGE